eukprot:gnl/TRDRNA2_/TRDRNA2_183163_c0_seq1.p1 gnl/TRDRNA2_/TRDRNA2_183163_c0~~gnl/TRDRNA2_/TRDRNA2_183163_c0_seq1.p1  ORF type:complete len:355 (+),score=55.65 gnl/TRDRNA2_/TRDRNA2_183163_c0_seq1:64-1128(+)
MHGGAVPACTWSFFLLLCFVAICACSEEKDHCMDSGSDTDDVTLLQLPRRTLTADRKTADGASFAEETQTSLMRELRAKLNRLKLSDSARAQALKLIEAAQPLTQMTLGDGDASWPAELKLDTRDQRVSRIPALQAAGEILDSQLRAHARELRDRGIEVGPGGLDTSAFLDFQRKVHGLTAKVDNRMADKRIPMALAERTSAEGRGPWSTLVGSGAAQNVPVMPNMYGMAGMPVPPGLPGYWGTQALPGMPGMPGAQPLPGFSGMPGMQGMPGTPSLQAMPAMLGVPGAPAMLGMPGTQGMAVPGWPQMPSMPNWALARAPPREDRTLLQKMWDGYRMWQQIAATACLKDTDLC